MFQKDDNEDIDENAGDTIACPNEEDVFVNDTKNKWLKVRSKIQSIDKFNRSRESTSNDTDKDERNQTKDKNFASRQPMNIEGVIEVLSRKEHILIPNIGVDNKIARSKAVHGAAVELKVYMQKS